MITPKICLDKFGTPGTSNEGTYMITWRVPTDIQLAFTHVLFSAMGTVGFPNRIYCHALMVPQLEKAFRALMAAGLARELQTYDGCYVIRKMRGALSQSIHSWGLAIDVNQATNALGAKPTLSPAFVKCFTDNGFDWGGTWGRKDGMHFQLATV